MAADYLIHNGFTILERNYRCKLGEIDIIAVKDDIVRFIEVKYRKDFNYGYSAEAVSKRKQEKIRKCAQWFMSERNMSQDRCCSFDVIAIQGAEIEYIFNSYGAM